MGMYTELVLGFELKKHIPEKIINTLHYMIGTKNTIYNLDDDFLDGKNRQRFMLHSSSQYFAYSKPLSNMYYDEVSRTYRVSIRCNLKNYENEIHSFLHWIAPYIYDYSNFFLGYSMHEGTDNPTLIYLKDYLDDEYTE